MSTRDVATSPFRTWNDVEPHPFRPGIALHAIGGDQVLLCRVVYEPGTAVLRHAHDECEQVVAVVAGEVDVTVGDQTRTMRSGDVAVMSRGVEHELHSRTGCAFFEALAPVPLDHVPDFGRDIVLGPDGGSAHVQK